MFSSRLFKTGPLRRLGRKSGVSASTRTIIVHYGLPKTATTSVQNALFAHKADLLNDGLLYPGRFANHTNELCTAFLQDPCKHITNKLAGTPLEVLREQGRETLARFGAEIEDSPAERVVFSAEGLVNLSVEELTAFKTWLSGYGHDIRLHCVVRDPVTYSASVMQQLLKSGDTLRRMFLRPPQPGFRQRLEKAQTVFGRDRIALHAFEALAASERGFVGGFLDAIGLEGDIADTVIAAAQHDNASLTQGAALLLSKLNEARPMMVDGQRAPLRSEHEVMVLQGLKGAKFQLPPDVARKAFEGGRADVEWLNGEFGLDLYRTMPEAGEPPKLVEDEAFLTSLSVVLSDLISHRHLNMLQTQLAQLPVGTSSRQREWIESQIRRMRPAASGSEG